MKRRFAQIVIIAIAYMIMWMIGRYPIQSTPLSNQENLQQIESVSETEKKENIEQMIGTEEPNENPLQTYWTVAIDDYEVILMDKVPGESLELVVRKAGQEGILFVYEKGKDYIEPTEFTAGTFENLLGHNGFVIYNQYCGMWYLADYYALEDGDVLHLADSWGIEASREQEDYMVDLDDDGDRELICSVQYSGDGACRTMIYQYDGNDVLYGWGDDLLDAAYDHHGVGSYGSEYLSEENKIQIWFWKDELQDDVVKAYAIDFDKIYWKPYDMSTEWMEGIAFSEAYGAVEPVVAGNENEYAAIVKKVGEYKEEEIAHIYETDYDGDGEKEAFLIIGKEWNDKYEDYISGDLWFVDSEKNATCIQRGNSYRIYQEYIRENEVCYLFIHYNVGIPWTTDVYTVSNRQPGMITDQCPNRQKILNDKGQVIQWQDAYDGCCEIGYEDFEDGFWTGHTWKPYTFIFENGELIEIPAKEVSLEEVVAIAALPEDYTQGKEESEKQYILRENGELNINMAIRDEKSNMINFYYITYMLNVHGQWEYVESNMGIYKIQLSGESHWDYLNEYLSQN